MLQPIGSGTRGDVTIQPTLVINNRQYRGRLDNKAVLKAICSGFKETTEPALCLSYEIETNECLVDNEGCWIDKVNNITACKDTFRGKVCECPIVNGVKYVGDGYTHCEPSAALRCQVNKGGCWEGSKEGRNYTACLGDHTKGCECPSGFKGDGVNSCEDINECKEKKACQCTKCKCKNTWGSYECSCAANLLYLKEHDICISTRWPNSHWRSVKVGWDESTAGERQPRVSLWEIEPLTTFPMYPSLFPLRLKRPWYPGTSSLLSALGNKLTKK